MKCGGYIIRYKQNTTMPICFELEIKLIIMPLNLCIGEGDTNE